MRFSVLGSGSRGNATLVSNDDTHVLVDAGFSRRETRRRLASSGLAPGDLSAIVVTHEHGDHARGAGVLARADNIPLWMTKGTLEASQQFLRGAEVVHGLHAGRETVIGNLRILPFATLHDAADPIAVVVVDDATEIRLGIATDLGRSTAQARHFLQDCEGVVVEANHDEHMLWGEAAYPAAVKNRIASSSGHLSNQAAAGLLEEIWSPRLCAVVLAHLSEEANTSERARQAVEESLRTLGFRGVLHMARPETPTPLLDLMELRDRLSPSQPSFL